MVKSNKKGSIAIILFIIIFIIIGFFYLNSHGKIPFLQNHYFQKIDMPINLSKDEDISVEFQIINDGKTVIKPELEIIYNNDKWRTYNKYARLNDKIELDKLYPEQITTYSIEFESRLYSSGGEIYNFTFNLYDGDKLLESKVKNVQIKK